MKTKTIELLITLGLYYLTAIAAYNAGKASVDTHSCVDCSDQVCKGGEDVIRD